MVKPPSPSESAIVVHLPKISKGIEDSSRKIEDLQLEFLSLKKIFEDSFSSTSMIGKTSDSLKKMVSFLTKKETIESIKPAKKVESETTTKKLPFKSEVSKSSSDGLNFSKDFFNHLLKSFDDFFEDITTIFGFNFGKYFKDGLKQLFTGKGLLGGIIFGPFKIALKSISLILSGIKGVVGGLLGGIKSLSGNLLKKGVSAVTGVGKSIIDKGKTGVKNALIKPLFQTAGFSDFIENKESQDESEKINLKIQTLRNKLAENELKQETALGQEKFDLMVEAKELEQQEVGLIRRRVKLKSDQLQKEIDFFNQKEMDLLSKGEFEQARMTREESDRLIVKQSDLVSSDISPGDSLSETELVTKKSESRIENFISRILEFSSGTKGVLGQLFADFGEGTMTILHGKEAVVPENSVEGKILKDFESGKLNNFREAKEIEVIKPSTNSRSARGFQNILDNDDSSEFFDLNISNLIEIGESLKDISEKLDKIIDMNKEDSDRNEQLAESNISRQNLLDRVKKSGDSDESNKLTEKNQDKKSPFSFLKTIFSGIISKLAPLLPLVAAAGALLSDFGGSAGKFFQKIGEKIIEKSTKFLSGFGSEFIEKMSKNISKFLTEFGSEFIEKMSKNISKFLSGFGSEILEKMSKKVLDTLLGRTSEKVAKEVTEGVVEKGAKELAEGVVEKGAKEVTEGVVEKGAKELAEGVVEKGAKELAESAAEKGAKEVTEGVVEKGAKELAESAAEKGTKSLFGKILGTGAKFLGKAVQPLMSGVEFKNRIDAGQSTTQALLGEGADLLGSILGGFGGGAATGLVTGGIGTGVGAIGGAAIGSTVLEGVVDWVTGANKIQAKSIVDNVTDLFSEEKTEKEIKISSEKTQSPEMKKIKPQKTNTVKDEIEISKVSMDTEQSSKNIKESVKNIKESSENIKDSSKEMKKESEKSKSGFSGIFSSISGTVLDMIDFVSENVKLSDKDKEAFKLGSQEIENSLKGLLGGGMDALIEAFETEDLFGTASKFAKKVSKSTSDKTKGVAKTLKVEEMKEEIVRVSKNFGGNITDMLKNRPNKDSGLVESISETQPAAGNSVMSMLKNPELVKNENSSQTVIDASVKQISNSSPSSTTIISTSNSNDHNNHILSQRNNYA